MRFPIKKDPKFVITSIAVVLAFLIFFQGTTIYHPFINDSSNKKNFTLVSLLQDNPDLSIIESVPASYVELIVFDATSSLPLEAASVAVYDEITGANIKTGLSNINGLFNVTDLYVGSFKIVVSKVSASPYRTESYFTKIDVLGEIKKIYSFLVPELAIKGIIEATALDITGKPIKNVLVDIYAEDGTHITSEMTNESGIAVTSEPLREGMFTVNTSAVGYYFKNTTAKLEWYGDYKKITIVLLPKGTASAIIEITTKDAISENNLSYTHIEIIDTNDKSVWTGMTDVDGNVIVSKLDMGTYRITAHHDMYNEVGKEINLHHPDDYEILPFSMYPTSSNNGFIELHSITEDSEILSSASITLYNHKNQQIDTGFTDDSGFYNITDLAQGIYNLKVSADAFFDNSQEITIRWNADYKKLEVILLGQNKVGTLEVELLDISGTPLSSVLVKLIDRNGELVRSIWTDKSPLTISDLQLGKYTLETTKRGLQTFTTEINFLLSNHCEIRETLVPSKGTGSFDVYSPLNAYILVKNTDGETVFSGESESGETLVPNLPVGDYSISMFTEFGSQSVLGSIVWNGYQEGLSWQDMVDITDNSSCMEFTMWDIDTGLVENCRVDVITQNGYSFFGYTDSNGFINITGLFLGQYDVICSKYGYRDTIISKSIDYKGQKKISNLYIYKAYGDVHVHINEVFSGEPYPAYVRYKSQFWGEWTSLVRADNNGYRGFHNIPVGYYNFCVMSGAYETQYDLAYINYDGDFVNLNFMLTYPGGDGQIDYYALIVAGGTEQRFTHDAYNMYKTLTMYYGFTYPNTFLLTPHAIDSVSGQTVPRDASTSVFSVEWALNEIAMLADGDDQVVIWWTGHGGFIIGANDVIIDGQFQTHADYIGSTHFDLLLDGIFCNKMYIFLGPCHSGYWIDSLNDEPNRAIYTSCDWNEVGYANSDHSYWPWGTRRALDPSLSASSADDDNNGKISLFELYEWADHYVRVTKDKNQHPQRFVGSGVSYGSDLYKYIGDGTYGAPLAGIGSFEFFGYPVRRSISTTTKSSTYRDEGTGIAIIPSAGVIDNIWDNSDITFEIYNATLFPDHVPISNIQITIRDIYGSILASGFSNNDGFITLYDFSDGIYAWEAFYEGLVLLSDQISVQQAQTVSYAFSDNYDYQGDAADIKIQIEESKKGINLENVIVELYHSNGNYIGSKTSNFNGEVLFNDVEDGLYGYKVTFDDTILANSDINVRSSEFTLETDSISPKVVIVSPTTDNAYDLTEILPELIYKVDEENNYTISVYLNSESLGYKQNNSILTKITTSGSYSLRVVATDVAENVGYKIVEFIVHDSESTKTTQASNWFSSAITNLILIFLTSITRKRK